MFKIKNPIKDSFFDDINGRKLDKYQRKAILCNNKASLVIASAGSGKTLTIVGKINYLIEKLNYQENEILCLSFTNETVNNLREKLKYNVDVLTFHKLALDILKEHHFNYHIASPDLLDYIVNEFFFSIKYNFLLLSLLKEYCDNKISNKKIDILKIEIISFIHKIKCNDISFKKLVFLKKKSNSKEKIFLIFAFNILLEYILELNSQNNIDFDDMIINATKLIKTKSIKRNIKYIIIDEYQDISLIRFHLIYEIIKRTNAKIMCVGDDYQSIYGFSGSNLSLFVNFLKYFPKGKRQCIKYTYRNSYELIGIASHFIRKNAFQLKKNVCATFLLKYPVVLVYYEEESYLETYKNLINYLYLEKKTNILVLGRYNKNIDEVYEKKNSLNIKYLTVHASKGLEEDNVILLRMDNSYLGFPSKINNNYLFSLIDCHDEGIMYAEERRLFYVALTRCKERIYILVSKNNPSCFIEEIKSRCVELLLK